MNFRFLYDPQRQLFSIGYRLADAEGPGRLDASYYDLLASEARLASFIAIAKGECRRRTGSTSGRLVTSVRRRADAAVVERDVFEYLMPLLVMRSYPETLLDRVVPRWRCARQIEYAADARRALGHLGVGVQRRRPARQLPVQGVRRPGPRPEARARRRAGGRALRHRARRAWSIPTRGARTCGASPREGLDGRATASTRRSTTRTRTPTSRRRRRAAAPAGGHGRARLPRAPPGHDAGRARQRAARRPHGRALPRRPARAGHRAAAAGARAAPRRRSPSRGRSRRRASRAAGAALPVRRFRSPHTRVSRTRSSSRTATTSTVVTNAGGGASFCRGRAVTRLPRGRDARPGQPVPLPARRAQRRGLVGRPTSRRAASRTTTWSPSCAEKATFRRRDDEIATQLEIAVSTEDDVEVRRLSLTQPRATARARSRSRATPRSCSRPPADDLAHPAFGKLFVETEYLPEQRGAPLPPPAARPRTSRRSGRSTC